MGYCRLDVERAIASREALLQLAEGGLLLGGTFLVGSAWWARPALVIVLMHGLVSLAWWVIRPPWQVKKMDEPGALKVRSFNSVTGRIFGKTVYASEIIELGDVQIFGSTPSRITAAIGLSNVRRGRLLRTFERVLRTESGEFVLIGSDRFLRSLDVKKLRAIAESDGRTRQCG